MKRQVVCESAPHSAQVVSGRNALLVVTFAFAWVLATTALPAPVAAQPIVRSHSLSLTVPDDRPLGQVTVAGESVTLSAGSEIREGDAYGALGSLGSSDLWVNTGVDTGDIVARGNVALVAGSHVHGSIDVGGAMLNLFGLVDGAVREHQQLSTNILQRSAQFTQPCTGNINVLWGQTRNLAPGCYGRVTVYGGGTLRFAKGQYSIPDLVVYTGGRLDSTGPADVWVTSTFSHAGSMVDPTDSAIRVYYTGSIPVLLTTAFSGSVYAPNAWLKLLATNLFPFGNWTAWNADPSAKGHVGRLGKSGAFHQGTRWRGPWPWQGQPVYHGTFIGKNVLVGTGTTVVHGPAAGWIDVAINIAPAEACPGESVQLSVTATDPQGGAADVFINQTPTSHVYEQFWGDPGERLFAITVRADDGTTESMFATAKVKDCGGAATQFPLLFGDPDLYRPGRVNFTVRNALTFEDPSTHYIFDFGDGQTVDSTSPVVGHSYAPPASGAEYASYDVSVRVERSGEAPALAKHTFLVWDDYAIAKRRGVLEPPTQVWRENLTSAGWGIFGIENREAHDLNVEAQRIDQVPCDPDASPILGATIPMSWSVGPTTSSWGIAFVDPSALNADTCGVAVHYWATSNGQPAQFSVYFDTNRVDGPSVSADLELLLNHLVDQGLVSDPHQITGEELVRLYQERKIAYDRVNQVFYQTSPPPQDSKGWCDADLPESPPEAGYSCQPTGGWFAANEAVREGHIANAMKGDAIVVRSCNGFIVGMMGKLDPPQLYSHSGIMIENRTTLRHSTGLEKVLEDKPNGAFGFPTDGFQEYYLRYLWPGTVTASVEQAFGPGVELPDMDGKNRRVHGFARSEAQCNDTFGIVWPRVIKPAPEFESLVRPELHAAADAAKGINGHYRFSVYTEAAATPAGDPDGPDPIVDGSGAPQSWGQSKTVCSSFVRLALNEAGVVMDQDTNVPLPGDVTSDPSEGIYHYDPDERLAAGHALYASMYNEMWYRLEEFETASDDYWWATPALDAVPVVGPALSGLGILGAFESGNLFALFTDMPDDIASQVANCFASDFCSEDAKDSDRWHHPGHGFAVSPDDIMNHYDPPVLAANGTNVGGVFGYHERMIYRGHRYKPRFAWLPSAGTRTVHGTVSVLEAGSSQPTLVAGAYVEVQGVVGKNATTDASGSFSIAAVPAGNLTVYASQTLPSGVFLDGQSCYRLHDPSIPDGLLDEVPCADFGAAPIRASIDDVQVLLVEPSEDFRHVSMVGNAGLIDCDCCGYDVCKNRASIPFNMTCNVSELEVFDDFRKAPSDLCADEVGVEVDGKCTWLAGDVNDPTAPARNSVRVQGKVTLFEEESLSCGADADEDDLAFDFVLAPNGFHIVRADLTNQDVCVAPFPPVPFDCDDKADVQFGVRNERAQ